MSGLDEENALVAMQARLEAAGDPVRVESIVIQVVVNRRLEPIPMSSEFFALAGNRNCEDYENESSQD